MSALSHVAFLLALETPTLLSKGWLPLGFSREFTASPRRVDVLGADERDKDASALVVWRPLGREAFVRHDVCPHLGAVLSSSARPLKDGCLRCGYHGVSVGPGAKHAVARDAFGKTAERNGILWWTHDPEEASDPLCEELRECERRPDTTLSRFKMRVRASFGDCFRNSMDLHHAGWLHASTFGNRAEDPRGATTTTAGDEMRVQFEYVSNDARDVTGDTTANYPSSGGRRRRGTR